jgi:predicted GNAT family acetyltransferase
MSNAASSNSPVDPAEEVQVTRNDGEGRYEARIGDTRAGIAAFHRDRKIVSITHTEVDPAVEGQGVGGELARAALDDVRQQGWLVHPYCPFIRTWIKRHPDYADLVDPKWHLPESAE